MNRALLVAIPLVTVAVVAFAVLVAGAPRPYFAAQVYGGPTLGVDRLSWRVSVFEHVANADAPVRVPVLGVGAELGDGRRVEWRGAVDQRGMAEVRLDLGSRPALGPVRVEVTTPMAREPLAAGNVELSQARWLARARSTGGWISGKTSGELRIRAAPGRGVFAVPFRDPLWIEVRDAHGPVAGARLHLRGESLSVSPGTGVTSPSGRAVVRVAPRDFYVALSIDATTADGRHGSWYSTLPVVAGAFQAHVRENRLEVESPIFRRMAYYAIIDRHERLEAGSLRLLPDPSGGARGAVDLGPLPATALWAVISSEADLGSRSTVGWPFGNRPTGASTFTAGGADDPPLSLVVPDRLLLDGLPAARARDAKRRGRAQWLAAAFSLLAATLVALLLTVEVRGASARLAEHLTTAGEEAAEVDRISARRSLFWTLAIAVLCIALGFVAVALVAVYRIG